MRAHRQRNLSRHQKFFCKNVFHTKATPLWDRTIFGEVCVRGGMIKFSKWKSPLPGPDIEGRGQDKIRLASRLVLPLMPRTAPAPLFCIAIAMHSMRRSSLSTMQERRITYTVGGAGRVYPYEIDIQETHTNHRKLDSQATLPHATRDRAADGLCPKAWSLRPSRRDHDPGGLAMACGRQRSATCNGSRSSYPRAACTFTAQKMGFLAYIQSAGTRSERFANYAVITRE